MKAYTGSTGIALPFLKPRHYVWVGDQRHVPAALSRGKRPGIYCIGGWMGSRVGMDECGKLRPHRVSIP